MRRVRTLFLLCTGLVASPVGAATYADPDWPCIQRKVPALSVGQMWSGVAPEGNWRGDPEIADLAARIAARRTQLPEVEVLADGFVEDIPAEEREARLALLFAGIIDLIDAERGQLIEGIGRYAHNQTNLSGKIEALQGELVALRAADQAAQDLDRIEEIEDTLKWEARIFKDRSQALTFVCETPVLMEQRAFAIGRILAARI